MQNTGGLNNEVIIMALACLIPFIVAFIFFFFVLYRQKREMAFKQKEIEFRSQVAEVEMKALRAQINPHFIFNCMNSIYQFMHSNDLQKAEVYLVKISNLIRLVLENSIYTDVALKDDLDALKLYIELEQIRMIQGFDYIIEIDPALNVENVMVPPLMVQPFVENSIWHGLNGKSSKGNLKITISRDGEMLKYVLEDDGEETSDASKKVPPHLRKKKSLGMSLTQERLDVLNKMKNSNAHFTISDIRNKNNIYAGKRVELFLPYEDGS